MAEEEFDKTVEEFAKSLQKPKLVGHPFSEVFDKLVKICAEKANPRTKEEFKRCMTEAIRKLREYINKEL